MKSIKTNLNLYKSFLEVYETRNFSNAALNLRLTQPTISYNIKELEKQLRVRLFNSNSRGVEPTKNAEELYPVIRAAFVQLLHAESRITEFNEESKGIVRLNVSTFFVSYIAGSLIKNYASKYPNIDFTITSEKTEVGIDALERHESDVFIFTSMKPLQYNKEEIAVINLMEVENSFYASKGFMKKHGITSTITQEQLQDLPKLSMTGTSTSRVELGKVGITKNFVAESNSTPMLLNLAESNMGIVFGPEGYVGQNLVKLDVVGLEPIKCYVALAYNKDIANKAGSAFIDMVKSEFKK